MLYFPGRPADTLALFNFYESGRTPRKSNSEDIFRKPSSNSWNLMYVT